MRMTSSTTHNESAAFPIPTASGSNPVQPPLASPRPPNALPLSPTFGGGPVPRSFQHGQKRRSSVQGLTASERDGQAFDLSSSSASPRASATHFTSGYGVGVGGKMFPRSFTTGDASRHHLRNRTTGMTNNSRAVSYHPAGQGNPLDSSTAGFSDVERQSSGGNSSDVVLQGRSYRFQNSALPDPHHVPLVSPYTATSHTIRGSTALLADLALRGDEDADSMTNYSITNDRIDERLDEDGSPLSTTSRDSPRAKPMPIAGLSSSTLQTGSAPTSHQSKGPSNLSLAIQASNNISPSTPKTDSGATLTQASVGALVQQGDIPATESTPLIAPPQKRGTDRGRDIQQTHSLSERRQSKSHSRSKSPAEVIGDTAGQSSISLMSNKSGNGPTKNNSSTYGYGALVQASRAGGTAGTREHHVSFADSDVYFPSQTAEDDTDDNDNDEEDFSSGEELSLGWALVPKMLRPSRGSTAVAAFTNRISSAGSNFKHLTWHDVTAIGTEPVRLLPAVILGVLLNVLDGVSYGLIIFPTSYPMFSDFGGDGVSMFFVTCVISQLVYTLGGSIFKGGNGSMMIEVVPFYHILVTIIINTLGEDDPVAVVSTTMVAFALSSIFAGVVFLLLGYFRLGVLIGFFPRHILVGCIGGVGVFLIETGLEVAGQLKSEEGFQWNLETLRYFVQSWSMVAHWAPPFGLAILLRLITARFHHPLVFPAYFLVIPVFFYAVASGALRIPLSDLRTNDWVFDVGKAAEAPFWRFYTYFNFRRTSWEAVWATMPTQLALTFFSILHVPLNVPALAVSVNEDNLDTDRELLAHGISNILAGMAGSVPNYLCYVNSVLFYRVGGGSRLSGLMLAGGTFVIFLSGPGAIGYLPIMVVAALIFVLGIDLAKEAVWDTIGRVNAWEYFTIWLIIFVMTYYDFVVGILSGIIVACLFFVIQTSRRRTVRAVLDGSVARSTVRRHTTQRQFLDQAGQQTQIVKLQGFLYFANISGVEELIRRALDIATWQAHPIRFLLVDFSLVYGVDFSAAEAFTRIQRLLLAKDVVLGFCGVTPDSDVGIALRSVDLWTDSSMRLEVFQNLNEALEWTENEYLRNLYMSGHAAAKRLVQGPRPALDVPESKRAPAFDLNETSDNSPRRQHLFDAAQEAASRTNSRAALAIHRLATSPASIASSLKLASTPPPIAQSITEARRRSSVNNTPVPQPCALLTITFQAWAHDKHDDDFYRALAPYFDEVRLLKGEVLWQRGDDSDGLFVIEQGILKARYDFPQEDYEITEAMLAGTIAGELTFLSRAERNTTAYAEMDCTLWRLGSESLQRLRDGQHDVFDNFLQLLLCACSEEQECLMSYLVSRLS